MVIRYGLILITVLSYCLGPAAWAQSQQPSPDGGRKIIRKIAPQYPDAARRIGLGGTVKVVAVVAPDGNVKKVEAVGGSPILVQAAENAISEWKYAPGEESRENVELHFTP